MSQTYQQLRAKLSREIWPAGEAKSLVVPHDAFFLEAMIDLQRWVEYLQKNNVSIFPYCSAYWEDAKTVVEAPKGIIRRIYTVASRTPTAENQDEWNWRDKVHFWSANWEEMEIWARKLNLALTPENIGMQKLQQGFKFPHKTANDLDGRARTGIWVIRNRKLWVAPWLQSNEALVVEWDGKKTSWDAADVLNTDYWHPGVEAAIKLFVKYRHELHFGEPKEAANLRFEYGNVLADLIHDEREETRQQEKRPIGMEPPTFDEITDDEVPLDEQADYVTCILADSGAVGQPLSDVASQIIAQNPNKIFIAGDVSYGGAAYANVVDAVFPGWRTNSQLTTKLFAIPGNHDYDDIGIAAFEAFFTGNKGNKRYFSVIDGPVHFFFLSTDDSEADGGYVDANTSTENSIMGEWLRVQLALSTAKYKVVVGHHAPYTSDVNYTPGNKWMRWPFKTWGAHLYIDGHAHNAEYCLVDGFPYLTCGLGGHSIRGFGAITTGSQWRYNSDYAFLKLTANCTGLVAALVDRSGATIHEVEIA